MLRGNAGRDIQACGRIKPVRPATAGVSLVDERLGSAGEADERVRLDVVELAGDHEQVERVAELAVGERAQPVGRDDGVGQTLGGAYAARYSPGAQS